MVLENNIFKYATKELTQDAFICWVLSYYNKPEDKKLHSIAKNLIKKIIQKYKLKLPNHIEIVQQRTVSYKDEQDKNYNYKIDITIDFEVSNKKYLIFIEDKVNSNLGKNQIKKYFEGLENEKKYEKIIPVFLKTGYMTIFESRSFSKLCEELRNKTDIIKINNTDISKIIASFKGENQILTQWKEYSKNFLNKTIDEKKNLSKQIEKCSKSFKLKLLDHIAKKLNFTEINSYDYNGSNNKYCAMQIRNSKLKYGLPLQYVLTIKEKTITLTLGFNFDEYYDSEIKKKLKDKKEEVKNIRSKSGYITHNFIEENKKKISELFEGLEFCNKKLIDLLDKKIPNKELYKIRNNEFKLITITLEPDIINLNCKIDYLVTELKKLMIIK